MVQYICLLRGVNVGGNNTISMADLKRIFETLGFQEVRTYINSGNVLFRGEETDSNVLKDRCEQAILQAFNLAVTAVVFKASDLESAMERAPAWWGVESDAKHDAIFVIPPATAAEIVAAMGDVKENLEQVDFAGNLIFWSAPLATYSRTRWSKLVKTPYYGSITIRNANTAKKLLALTKKNGGQQ